MKNWSNELVLFYQYPDFIENWDEAKRDEQAQEWSLYRYPKTFIQFSGLVDSFLHLPYCQP